MKKIISIVVLVLISGCTDPQAARSTLTSSGYTNISIGGYDMFACGQDDVFSTKFIATNPSGQVVSGVVCSGFMKRGTVRF